MPKKSKSPPQAASETPLEMPAFVSLRFLALAAGLEYSQLTNLVTRVSLRIGVDRSRSWEDAQKRLGKKLISGEALALLVKYVSPTAVKNEPVEVPGDVFDKIRAAWKAIGAPGCSMLRTKDELEREILGDGPMMNLADVRVANQVEQLRFKRMQANRLLAMMCDRKTVEAELLQISLKLQRWMRTIPAQITGMLVEYTAFSDAELRAIEKRLQDSMIPLLREFRNDFAAVPADAAEVAAARRYADRGVASLPGKP